MGRRQPQSFQITPTVEGAQVGDRLGDQFELVKLLGRGGMGEVWEARDLHLERTVAVKVLPATLTQSERAAKALRQEAARAIDLAHPGLARVYHFGFHGGTPFVVMERIEGTTLSKLLDAEEKIEPAAALAILAPLAEALDHAHAKGLVHRDVKPSNVMVRSRDGSPVLIDFGIAGEVRDQTTRQGASLEVSTVGTLSYMSPEQVRGKRPAPSMDVYALAAVAYEMVSGEPPFFRGDPMNVQYQILNEAPEPPAEVDPGFVRALLRGLAKEAGDRPGSAGALVEELRSGLAGGSREVRSSRAEPTAPVPPAPPVQAVPAPAPPGQAAEVPVPPVAAPAVPAPAASPSETPAAPDRGGSESTTRQGASAATWDSGVLGFLAGAVQGFLFGAAPLAGGATFLFQGGLLRTGSDSQWLLEYGLCATALSVLGWVMAWLTGGWLGVAGARVAGAAAVPVVAMGALAAVVVVERERGYPLAVAMVAGLLVHGLEVTGRRGIRPGWQGPAWNPARARCLVAARMLALSAPGLVVAAGLLEVFDANGSSRIEAAMLSGGIHWLVLLPLVAWLAGWWARDSLPPRIRGETRWSAVWAAFPASAVAAFLLGHCGTYSLEEAGWLYLGGWLLAIPGMLSGVRRGLAVPPAAAGGADARAV